MTKTVAHLVLSLPIGGTERLVERMVRHPPAGYATACLCLDGLGDLGEELRQDGFKLAVLNRKPGHDWRMPGLIAAFCRREGVVLLHCHQYTPWFYGILARLYFPRLQVVFTEHGRFHPDVSGRARRIFNRVFGRLTPRITAVSESVRDALIQVDAFPPARVEVLLNGAACPQPAADKQELRRRLGLEAEAVYAILCARFDPIKWIEGLVEAFARVSAEYPPARLLLVGDGPEKEAIEARIQDLGLGDKITRPGFVRNIPDYLAAADVFVLCSHSEGTSVSLMESMAIGLPAVLTRVGGNPKVAVEGKTALFVPPRNVEALAETLTRMMKDEPQRRAMGAEAKRHYDAHFRPEIMTAKYGAIYDVLTASESGA